MISDLCLRASLEDPNASLPPPTLDVRQPTAGGVSPVSSCALRRCVFVVGVDFEPVERIFLITLLARFGMSVPSTAGKLLETFLPHFNQTCVNN